jgi:hypothetical protein
LPRSCRAWCAPNGWGQRRYRSLMVGRSPAERATQHERAAIARVTCDIVAAATIALSTPSQNPSRDGCAPRRSHRRYELAALSGSPERYRGAASVLGGGLAFFVVWLRGSSKRQLVPAPSTLDED